MYVYFCHVFLNTTIGCYNFKTIFQFDRKQWYIIVLMCISSITEENGNLVMFITHVYFVCVTCFRLPYILLLGCSHLLSDWYLVFNLVLIFLRDSLSVDNFGGFLFNLLREYESFVFLKVNFLSLRIMIHKQHPPVTFKMTFSTGSQTSCLD